MTQTRFAPLPFNQPFFDAFAQWNGQIGESVAAINREWMDFLGRRVRQDLALAQQFSSARNPEEFWRVYARFWTQAAEDYQREFAELSRLSAHTTEQAMASFQDAASFGGGAGEKPGGQRRAA